MSALLEIDQLAVRLPIEGQLLPIIRDITISLAPGEALGIVGESGSGKSMTLRSVLRLLPPLVVSQAQLETAARAIETVLAAVPESA